MEIKKIYNTVLDSELSETEKIETLKQVNDFSDLEIELSIKSINEEAIETADATCPPHVRIIDSKGIIRCLYCGQPASQW